MSAALKYRSGDRKQLQHILRDAGFRSTEGRLALLAALKRTHKPRSVEARAGEGGARHDEANV